MNEIAFISTSPSLIRSIKAVLEDDKLSYPIFETDQYNAIEIGKKAIEEGTKVIISRGGLAEILADALPIPIVSIPYRSFDFHQSIQKAQKISDRIGVIGATRLSYTAEEYREITKMDSQQLLGFFHPCSTRKLQNLSLQKESK